MRRRAFTLVELMTVVAILAILYAIFMPVVVQVKNFAQQWVAGESMAKLGTATTMYMMDCDETFPVAYYQENGHRQNWFGIIDKHGQVDPDTSLMKPYIKGKIQHDAALNAQPYMGDDTGYGYNWGYLGSDYYLPDHISDTLQCQSPAVLTSVEAPSGAIEYASSSFFYAKWMPKGDGATYRYGFVDPPKVWFGNPTVDFRHMGTKTIDTKKHEVNSTGLALLLFADGHLKPIHQKDVKNQMFERNPSLDN